MFLLAQQRGKGCGFGAQRPATRVNWRLDTRDWRLETFSGCLPKKPGCYCNPLEAGKAKVGAGECLRERREKKESSEGSFSLSSSFLAGP